MRRQTHAVLIMTVLAATASMVTSQTKFCFRVERKDVQEIWWASEFSVLCKDWDFQAQEATPAARDLGLNIHNGSLRIIVDGGYSSIDDEFLTDYRDNLTMSVYSTQSQTNLFLKFDTSLPDNTDPRFGKMFYTEEKSGGSICRLWTIYLRNQDLSTEGHLNDFKQNICFLLMLYSLFLLHEFYPTWISLEALIEAACLAVFIRIPIQTYVFSFGYVTCLLTVMLLAWLATIGTRKLPGWLFLKHSCAVAVFTLYSISQFEYTYMTVLIPLIATIAVFFVSRRLVTSTNDSIADKMLFLFLLGFIGANILENPYTLYYKIKRNTLDYESNWRYSSLMFRNSLLSAAVVLVFGIVGQLVRANLAVKRLVLDRAAANRYTLNETGGSISPFADNRQDTNMLSPRL